MGSTHEIIDLEVEMEKQDEAGGTQVIGLNQVAMLEENEELFENHLNDRATETTYITKMYCSHREPPGVCERRRSVNLEESIPGENQTLGGHSGRPSE